MGLTMPAFLTQFLKEIDDRVLLQVSCLVHTAYHS